MGRIHQIKTSLRITSKVSLQEGADDNGCWWNQETKYTWAMYDSDMKNKKKEVGLKWSMQFIDEKYKRASDKGVVEKEWPIVLFFCKSLRVLLSFSICPYPDIKQNKIKLQYPKLQATHNVWDNSKQKFREFLRMPFSFFYPDAPCPCSAFMSQ